MKIPRFRFRANPIDVAIIGFAIAILVGFPILPSFTFAVGLQKSADSRPYDLVLKFDKLVLACLILWRVGRAWVVPWSRRAVGAVAGWTLGCATLLMALALASHYVRVDLGWPDWGSVWILNNLVLVCFGEEAFFRLFLFEKLRRLRPAPVVAISALLFGLAHARGGFVYVALASVAGIFYGLAYRRAGWAGAVAAHFSVNFVHFVAFSYPSLIRMH